MIAVKSHVPMILKAKCSPVLFRANTRRNRPDSLHVKGKITTTTYDPTWKLFPVKTQSPIATLSTKTEWDMTCGAPTRQAGFNGDLTQTSLTGEVTTQTYDALCRPLRTDTPGGGYSLKTYLSLGSPLYQRIQTDVTPPGGQSVARNLYENLDGFGRSYHTWASGRFAGDYIETQTSYNPRGEVDRETAPYYTGETPQWTSYDYDALDRLVKTSNPDASTSTLSYALAPATSANILDVTATAEHGKSQTYALDADGQLTARTKWDGTRPVTRYTRDVLGRITGVTDPKLNQWSYAY
jgi:YD repeat-containing protein